MPLAWFICPYKRRAGERRPTRYCAMDDYTLNIVADGGAWSETEILGDHAIVKVRAAATTLTTIAAASGFLRIPGHAALTDTLGDLTAEQRTAIRNKLQALGYTAEEIKAALPTNWQTVTLGQVLRFAATRRLKPRHDATTDTIICDGEAQSTRPIESVDAAVIA